MPTVKLSIPELRALARDHEVWGDAARAAELRAIARRAELAKPLREERPAAALELRNAIRDATLAAALQATSGIDLRNTSCHT